MNDTQKKILDVAERLTQTHGFNGFSYLDVAEEIGIKAASIHYYFRSKDDLAAALVNRIRECHGETLRRMSVDIDTPQERFKALIGFFKTYIAEEKFCMCGMMSAELQSVSLEVKSLLNGYFNDFRSWLADQFEAMGEKDADGLALRFVCTLEGALLLARLNSDPEIVSQSLRGFSLE